MKHRLIVHAARQAQDPKNWCFAGDLGHVNELLDELLECLHEQEPPQNDRFFVEEEGK